MDTQNGHLPPGDMERTISVFITGLPNGVQAPAVDLLIGRLARLLMWDAEVGSYLEQCELQPTTRAAVLAAAAAVAALFAHEAGQEVSDDQIRDMLAVEAEEEAPHADSA